MVIMWVLSGKVSYIVKIEMILLDGGDSSHRPVFRG